MESGRRALVGMSGGVDSTVAALLLLRDGWQVEGATMEVAPADAKGCGDSCYGAENMPAIKDIAGRLGIGHCALDLRAEYAEAVLAYFRSEYLAGRTPNPCVMCNRLVKFGSLLDKAASSGLSFKVFATGHYARLEHLPSGAVLLKKGVDKLKDQSYFLWNISAGQLRRVSFPLGGLTKKQVRELAAEAGFGDLAGKPESQDFAPPEAVAKMLGPQSPGAIIDENGNRLGKHVGIANYTVGQRKGLGIGGLERPLFVTALDSGNNTVRVGPRESLEKKALRARSLNWISVPPPRGRVRVWAKIRRQHEPAQAWLEPESEDSCVVEFLEGQFAPTPGQSAVFYDGDLLLGGGVIDGAW